MVRCPEGEEGGEEGETAFIDQRAVAAGKNKHALPCIICYSFSTTESCHLCTSACQRRSEAQEQEYEERWSESGSRGHSFKFGKMSRHLASLYICTRSKESLIVVHLQGFRTSRSVGFGLD